MLWKQLPLSCSLGSSTGKQENCQTGPREMFMVHRVLTALSVTGGLYGGEFQVPKIW